MIPTKFGGLLGGLSLFRLTPKGSTTFSFLVAIGAFTGLCSNDTYPNLQNDTYQNNTYQNDNYQQNDTYQNDNSKIIPT